MSRDPRRPSTRTVPAWLVRTVAATALAGGLATVGWAARVVATDHTRIEVLDRSRVERDARELDLTARLDRIENKLDRLIERR